MPSCTWASCELQGAVWRATGASAPTHPGVLELLAKGIHRALSGPRRSDSVLTQPTEQGGGQGGWAS